jgi:hypothetical protein
MLTVKDVYKEAMRTWFNETLCVSKESYTAADMADIALQMIMEGRF